MIKVEELRDLTRPSAVTPALAIAFDWLLLAANFALLIYFPNPLVWIFAFVFAARQQLALAILMHDGAHRRLFKSAKVNDYICQFLCSAPLFFSMYSYQKLHLKHHRDPLAADDPDLSLIGGYPISKASFARKLARDACGVSYFKFIRYFIHMARKQRAPPKELKPRVSPSEGSSQGPELKAQAGGSRMSTGTLAFSIILVNVILWLALFELGHGWLYLFFWVLPAITALQVLLRIRGIAEHAGYQPSADQRTNARTVLNPLQTFFFAPHNVAYHIEHHIYPAVPYYNLPKLHRLMMADGQIPEANVFRGYGAVLRDLVR